MTMNMMEKKNTPMKSTFSTHFKRLYVRFFLIFLLSCTYKFCFKSQKVNSDDGSAVINLAWGNNFNFVKQRKIHFLPLYSLFEFWFYCTSSSSEEQISKYETNNVYIWFESNKKRKKIKKNKQSESCAKKGAFVLFVITSRTYIQPWIHSDKTKRNHTSVKRRILFLFCSFTVFLNWFMQYFNCNHHRSIVTMTPKCKLLMILDHIDNKISCYSI